MRSHCHLSRSDWRRLYGQSDVSRSLVHRIRSVKRNRVYIALRGPLLNRYDLPLFADPAKATVIALTSAEAAELGVLAVGAVGADLNSALTKRRLPSRGSIPARLIIEGPVGLRPLRQCWVGVCLICEGVRYSPSAHR